MSSLMAQKLAGEGSCLDQTVPLAPSRWLVVPLTLSIFEDCEVPFERKSLQDIWKYSLLFENLEQQQQQNLSSP